MHRGEPLPIEPWHRNPWVWLLIAIPALTIVGCAVTLYLAVSRPDYLVKDTPAITAPARGAADRATP